MADLITSQVHSRHAITLVATEKRQKNVLCLLEPAICLDSIIGMLKLGSCYIMV